MEEVGIEQASRSCTLSYEASEMSILPRERMQISSQVPEVCGRSVDSRGGQAA